MKSVRENVDARIDEILNAKAEELANLAKKIPELQEESQRQEAALNDAMKVSDLAAYEKAKIAKNKADNAIEMYTKRTDMLKAGDLISEDESDAVLDSLIDYRRETWEKFKTDVTKITETLNKMLSDYAKEQDAIQLTFTRWTREIHVNKRLMRGILSKPSMKEAFGERTNRIIPITAPDDYARGIVSHFIFDFRARKDL